MIRTTVMLPEATYERLRRLARHRRLPLAAVIREALTDVAESETPRRLSFIGAVDIEGVSAEETIDSLPPLSPFRTAPPTPAEIEHFRRLADERARKTSGDC